MSFSADELEDGAREATGLEDFGSPYYREGLERTVEALNTEADLNDLGNVIQHATISNALIQRLRIVDTYKQHPEIDDEVVGGPVFVIGLPRTGTTALSQLVASDPQFRSLRMWESQACTPPPEAATQHTDPRIAAAAEGIAMMDNMFPRMKTMMNSEPEAPTECQDLMGMSFRTFHFDGVVRVPGYLVLADAVRYAGDIHLPPAGAQAPSVALPADAVASEDTGAHVRTRRSRRGISECQIPLEPS